MNERDEMKTIIWDLYKDVYGVRPRGFDFESMTLEDLKEWFDRLVVELEAVQKEEEEIDAVAVADFKEVVRKTIDLGAGDEKTALRWMTYGVNDISHWLWQHGILFTDYGSALEKQLLEEVAS